LTTTDRSYRWPGIPLALASAVLFGASTPFSKLLLSEAPPQLLAGVLYLGAGIGLAVLQLARAAIGLPSPEAPLRCPDLPWLAAIILFGGVIGPLSLMLGLARTDAASAALLLNLEGLATMAIAWLVFKENADWRVFLGALAILAGAVTLAWRGGEFHLDPGALLVAGACLAWGIDNNLTRKLSATDPVSIATVKGLVAGTVNILLAFAQGQTAASLQTLGLAAILGFFSIGLSLVLFMLALRHLGTARTGAYFSMAPFIGALIAVVLLREPLSSSLAISAGLMGLGLWLHLSERHEHRHVHEALEHEHIHVHDEHHRHEHAESVIEPHSHWHRHEPIRHSHPHYPDIHHRHPHPKGWPISPLRALTAVLAMGAIGAFYAFHAQKISFLEAPLERTASEPARRTSEIPPPPSPPERPTQTTGAEAPPQSDFETDRAHAKATLPNGATVNFPLAGAEAAILARLRRPTPRLTWFALERVEFAPEQLLPELSSSAQIENVAKLLIAYPHVSAIIAAYRNRGASPAEQRLAKARAASVLQELTRLGVSPSRLKTQIVDADGVISAHGRATRRSTKRRDLSLGLLTH
jgi:drug/metabolite transporter (DMT)-like permease/outer membrane protein OmpA-like peptidoglycan-associated protein